MLPGHSKSTRAIHVTPFAVSWVQMTNSSLLPTKAALSLGTCLVGCLPLSWLAEPALPIPFPVRISSSPAATVSQGISAN